MKTDPAHTAKTTVAQQLAEQATDKTVHTWDQIVPTCYGSTGRSDHNGFLESKLQQDYGWMFTS